MKDQIGEIVERLTSDYKNAVDRKSVIVSCETADLGAILEALCGWQDISTAPKDGNEILLGIAEPNGAVCAGFWHDGSECYGHRVGAGWFSEDDRCNLLIASNWPATHWQPLPAPPKESCDGL